MKNFVNNIVHSTKEKWLPINTISTFATTGAMTPEEYVQAGDKLIENWPMWSWQRAELNEKDYLPKQKQYLVARGLLSTHRYKEYAQVIEDNEDTDLDFTNINIEKQSENVESCIKPEVTQIDHDDFDCAWGVIEEEDDAADYTCTNAMKAYRWYDLSMTYDKVYLTPRIWINGRDTWSNQLDHKSMCEDISPDHLGKTVTVEVHPFRNDYSLSIHPCQQTNMLKKMLLHQQLKKPSEAMEWIVKVMITILPTIDFVGYS
jgi:ubiquitin-like-conjugating enzyme ATG3